MLSFLMAFIKTEHQGKQNAFSVSIWLYIYDNSLKFYMYQGVEVEMLLRCKSPSVQAEYDY